MQAVTSRELRERWGRLVKTARAIYDQEETVTQEDRARFDDLMARADALKAEIDDVERTITAGAEQP